jgi:hypothetical protein
MAVLGTHELATLDRACQTLASARSLDEIKELRDKAEAARTFAKAANLGLELQNRATELKLRAERKAGKVLASMELRGGDRRSKWRGTTLKLTDLGISRNQSKRWQDLAAIAEHVFCEYLQSMSNQGREITYSGLMRIVRNRKTKQEVALPVVSVAHLASRSCHRNSDERLFELTNHLALLSDVLRPLFESEDRRLWQSEKRIASRLLAEIGELIRQLNGSHAVPHASAAALH